jgi:hypothetical protein
MRLLTVLRGPDAEEICCSLEVVSLRAGLHYEFLSIHGVLRSTHTRSASMA